MDIEYPTSQIREELQKKFEEAVQKKPEVYYCSEYDPLEYVGVKALWYRGADIGEKKQESLPIWAYLKGMKAKRGFLQLFLYMEEVDMLSQNG